MDKKIAIIGYGYVGKVMYDLFKEHFDMVIFDPILFKWNEQETEDAKEQVNTCDLAVVCVPTPMKEDGSVNLSIIDETFEWLKAKNILIKSTILPGTTKKLSKKYGKEIVFSPEYIGESSYVIQWWKDKSPIHPTDMKYHDFQIFGGEKVARRAVLQFFKTIFGPSIVYAQTDSTTAELLKYMENSWGAMKVTFFNEFYDIAEAFDVDYDELRELYLLDGRAEKMHTAVFPEKRGFGGKCLPKDVSGLAKASEQAGYKPELLKSVLEVNKTFNGRNNNS